jgi:hypothetical protein
VTRLLPAAGTDRCRKSISTIHATSCVFVLICGCFFRNLIGFNVAGTVASNKARCAAQATVDALGLSPQNRPALEIPAAHSAKV